MDYFALLNEPRRPWLDADLLKQKFLTLSATIHPDKIHSADDIEKSVAAKKFAELNAAYNRLVEPKSRLLHLVELERGVKLNEIQRIPAALAGLFAEVAMICKNADDFLAEKNKITSPLLQVQSFERAQNWIEQLNALKKNLNGLRENLNTELKSLDEAWMNGARDDILSKLEELYRLFGYFNRWNNQIQERITRLML